MRKIFILIAGVLLLNFFGIQKVSAQQILNQLFNKEGVLYLKDNTNQLDLSKPILTSQVAELQFATEAGVYAQYIQINHIRKGNKIKEVLEEKSGSETIVKIDMASFELQAGDLIKLEVIRAIKINEKTGKQTVYKFKDPFFNFTIK